MDIGWWFIGMFSVVIVYAIGKEVYLTRKYGEPPREEKKPPRKSRLQQAKELAVLLFLIVVMIIVLCIACEEI